MHLSSFVQSPTLIYISPDYRNRQPPSTKHSKTEEHHILSTSTSEQKDSYEDCSSQAVDADDYTVRITKGRSQQSSEIAKLKMELLAEKVGYR